MWLNVGLITAVVFLLQLAPVQSQDYCEEDGCTLGREASYFVTAPKKVRPDHVIQLSVSILKLYYPQITVRCAIRRDREDVIFAERTFTAPGHSIVQLKIPKNAEPGNYTLRVEGSEKSGIGGSLFLNETKLIYDSKQLAVFILPIRPFFRQGQTVYFRVIPLLTNLMSKSGSMDVYIQDPSNTTVKRWLAMQTNAGGVLELQFPLSKQPKYGMWHIRVDAFGHEYYKEFEVIEFFLTYIDVNVSMPLYHIADDYAIGGTIMANMSIGQSSRGNVTITAEIRLPPGKRDPNKVYTWPKITRPTRYFPGTADFMFSMEELTEANNDVPVADHEVYVEAEVFDWFTRNQAKGSALTVIYSNDVELHLLGDAARTFKPNQTLDVYYAVRHLDNTPLNRPRRQVTINYSVIKLSGSTTSNEEKLITRDDGIVHWKFTPPNDAKLIRMTAYYDNMETRVRELTAYRHYSPTQSYITIRSSTETPAVDKYMVFTVTTNTFVEVIYYLLTSGGNIVTGGVLEMTSTQKTFSIALSRDMIPEAHIIVWHILKGEVISDSLNFFINGTRLNPVNIKFNRGKDFTGNSIELSGMTDPSSYIGAQVMDYELWAKGWSSFITEIDIVRELQTFDNHVNRSFQYVWQLPEEQEQLVTFPAPTYGIDANTTFEYAGLLVLTDANVTRIPHDCNETLGDFPCMDGTCYRREQWCDGTRQCTDGQDEMGCSFEEKKIYTEPRKRLSFLTRHFLRKGTWLWGSHFVMPNGRLDVITEIPDEPMTWILGGFAISKDRGFGIIHNPPRHEGTRPFYVRTEAPMRVRKGEQVGLHVGLFNVWEQDVEALVMLHDSEDYRFIVVEDYGIVESYMPRLIRGDIQTMVYVPKGRFKQIQMPVLPIKDGCVIVTVSVFSFIWTHISHTRMCTTYDGVTNHLHTPYFLDLISSGSLPIPDLEIPVDERFVKPEERKHLYVPGSPKAVVGIVGDVVGPGFFKDYPTSEDTLRKPWGGAEQNMYNFAYTLYNLLYQKQTEQLKESTLLTSLTQLDIALQRQLSYMNEDGSFQMFRDYPKKLPSIWVTAFTLRILNEANVKEWEAEYFFIPADLLNRITYWLAKQNNNEGAFVEISPIYDIKMQPNKTMNDSGILVETHIPLTSYVLIALSEIKGISGSAVDVLGESRDRARNYLEKWVEKVTDPYEMCIMTYALEVSGSGNRAEAFRRMKDLSYDGENEYWTNEKIPDNPIRVDDTLPYYQPRRWYHNEGYAVEATSYALLSFIRRNYLTDAMPMMKWLQTMRNTYAGMASTQDSVMALKALVEYAKMDTNRALYNIELRLRAVSMDNETQTIRLDRSNWCEMQEVNVFPVWGSVRGDVQGTGLALIQLGTDVNVEYPEQIKPVAQEKYFDVTIERNYAGRNSSILNMEACARWTRPDLRPMSGLSVMEVHVPSGFVTTNDVLRAYTQSGEVPNMHRAEMSDDESYERKMVFYFDYLSMDWTCVKWRMDRWFPIANMTIQHIIKVYDYYEPGMHNTTLFTTYTLFNHHVCQVCASFQCPYCPFYNEAATITSSLVLSFLTTILAFVLATRLSGLQWT